MWIKKEFVKAYWQIFLMLIASTAFLCLSIVPSMAEVERASEGGIFVPAYSSVVYGNKEREINLATTLVIRNLDPKESIIIQKVEYLDEHGKTVQSFLEKEQALGPLASLRFVVPEKNEEGGVSPSFLIRWRAVKDVMLPMAQAVMVGTMSSQGLSLLTEGHAIP